MKICIFGAGAIGGYLGAKLCSAKPEDGPELILVTRGPHLAAIRNKGLTLLHGDSANLYHPKALEDPAEAGPQDYVLVTLKAHSVAPAVAAMGPLLGPKTTVVWAVNGVPWWYFHGLKGKFEGRRLTSVDPDGVQWAKIGPERTIGCVVYAACDVPEPGCVRHISGHRIVLGELGGEETGRVSALSRVLSGAGLEAIVAPRIRDEIWQKLWGNCCFNPISALTGATLEQIASDPGTRALCRKVMVEAQMIGQALGVRFAMDVDRRIEEAGAVGAHKTSMLQDLERGRPMEIDALVTAVQEMGELTGTPTPALDAVLALIQARAETEGLYTRPGSGRVG